MKYRLALDLGTNSIGWAIIALGEDPADYQAYEYIDGGVRIYPDGREPPQGGRVGESLAVERRIARGMRRRRDRMIDRRGDLIDALVRLGLMPGDKSERKALEDLDPYELRARAVNEALDPHELGRALFHLNQRRGFKSNRKTDGDDEEKGKIKPKISELRDRLGNRTLGEFLHDRIQEGNSARFRADGSDFYPDRAMYEAEFDKIREVQTPHQNLPDKDWENLKDIIFYQRHLKPVERGKCEFFITEPRAHKDLPVSQLFRTLQELNNLLWFDQDMAAHKLTRDQRDAILHKLARQKTMTFKAMKKLKDADGDPLFPGISKFNLEDDRRKGLDGLSTAIDMASSKFLGGKWEELTEAQQNDLLEALHAAETDDALVEALTRDFSLTEEEARRLAKFKLASATMHVSRAFMEQAVPIMQEQGLRYDEAVAEMTGEDGKPLHHSLRIIKGDYDRLPYYGEVLRGRVIGGKPDVFDGGENPEGHYGKINNPTVHVALNQLRRVINRLIDRYGIPHDIHVELSRELKKTKKARDEISKLIAKNQKENDRRAKLCREHGIENPSALDLKKIKLWEELDEDMMARRCVFSGRTISAAMLFNGEAEIEHILPFSKTLDDGMANLTVSTRQANRLKGNHTPYEAFGSDQHADKGYVWADIAERAKKLPPNKRWRFAPDAMEQFEKDSGFIARQMTDNAYIARVTRQYLAAIVAPEKIVMVPGRLTAMLRGKWHLNALLSDHNRKDRSDQRHHAIDAFVVGLTTQSVLQHVARQSARTDTGRLHLDVPDIDHLRDQLAARLDSMVVSYKPDHGENAKMFKETAYGYVDEEARDPGLPKHDLVTRKPITSLKEKELGQIRDPLIRQKALDYWQAAKARGEKIDKAMAEFGKVEGIRRVRLLMQNQSAIEIRHGENGEYHKRYAPDAFVCVDIWQVPKGKPGKWRDGEYVWEGDFWSVRDYRNPPDDPNARKPHPAAKKIMRLFKNDMVLMDDGNGNRMPMRVAGFSTTDNKLDLRPHRASEFKRKFISINVLKDRSLEKIKVLEDGRILGRPDDEAARPW